MARPPRQWDFASEPEPRLKTSLWVQAQVRFCDRNFIPVAVVRKGDPDAGAVTLRLLRGPGKNLLLKRQLQMDGSSAWAAGAGGEPVDDATAEAQLSREIGRDPDLWIIEVEDPKGLYWPDAPIAG